MMFIVSAVCRFVIGKDFEVQGAPGHEDDVELESWLSSSQTSSLSNEFVTGNHVTRFLPPGTVRELYETYSTVQNMLGQDATSYSTFLRVYEEKWSKLLQFRQKTLFTQCELCQRLKGQVRDPQLQLQDKLELLKQYRAHVEDQYRDRVAMWNVQNAHDGDILCIAIDGCDQSKFSVPRDPQLRTSSALNLRQVQH